MIKTLVYALLSLLFAILNIALNITLIAIIQKTAIHPFDLSGCLAFISLSGVACGWFGAAAVDSYKNR